MLTKEERLQRKRIAQRAYTKTPLGRMFKIEQHKRWKARHRKYYLTYLKKWRKKNPDYMKKWYKNKKELLK